MNTKPFLNHLHFYSLMETFFRRKVAEFGRVQHGEGAAPEGAGAVRGGGAGAQVREGGGLRREALAGAVPAAGDTSNYPCGETHLWGYHQGDGGELFGDIIKVMGGIIWGYHQGSGGSYLGISSR